jgi:ribonuclease P protein component
VTKLPSGSLFVVRALKENDDKNVQTEITQLIEKLIARAQKIEARP